MSIEIGQWKDRKTGEIFYFPIIDGVKYDNFITKTEDLAMLEGLGIKYLGTSSGFAIMAARMLKIDLDD